MESLGLTLGDGRFWLSGDESDGSFPHGLHQGGRCVASLYFLHGKRKNYNFG